MAGGDYGIVRGTFWTDPEIKRVLSPDQKTLLLYWFTGPHSNLIGLYYCPFEYAASETGLPVETVRDWTLGALARFVTYDETTEEVFVHGAGNQRIGEELKAGDNRVKAILKAIEETHSRNLVRRFLTKYAHWPLDVEIPPADVENLPFQGATEAPSEAPSKPLTGALTEHKQEQEVNYGARAGAREPPGDPDVVDVERTDAPGESREPPAQVIELRPGRRNGELPFAGQDWSGRVSGAVVYHEWARLQEVPPGTDSKRRYKAVCQRLADAHTTEHLALAFIGIECIWPHAPPPIGKGEVWTPLDLEKRFDKALPAARDHPAVKQARTAGVIEEVARRKRGSR